MYKGYKLYKISYLQKNSKIYVKRRSMMFYMNNKQYPKPIPFLAYIANQVYSIKKLIDIPLFNKVN